MHFLFWCGNVVLMDRLSQNLQACDLAIRLLRETVQDNTFTYEVEVNNVSYVYRCSMDSNTRLEGTLIVEGDGFVSPIYTIDKTAEFVHVAESSVDYRDIYFVSKYNLIDIYVKNNKKTSMATISVDMKGTTYHASSMFLPIRKSLRTRTPKYVRSLFAIAGVVNLSTFTAYDVVSYLAKSTTLYVYKDRDIQIFGVETDKDSKTSILHCLDSIYNQTITFTEKGDNSWQVKEVMDGIFGPITRREYLCQVTKDTVLLPEKGISFRYWEENDNLHFTKN